MSKIKHITPAQRARQAALRQMALQQSLSYEVQIRKKRRAVVFAAINSLKTVPPQIWEEEVPPIQEPYMYKLLSDMYVAAGVPVAVDVERMMLNQKAIDTDVFARALYAWCFNNMGEKINLMSDTVNKWLQKTIQEVFALYSDQGVENIVSKMMAEVKRRYIQVEGWMVRRIVQTETMHSLNIAGREAVGVLGIDYEKTWSISGINTRDTHLVLDGVTIGQEEIFNVGGFPMEYPMDDRYGAPANEIINCACSLIYLPKDNNITEI